MNEVRVEEERLQELEENENVWKEGNRNPENKNENERKFQKGECTKIILKTT